MKSFTAMMEKQIVILLSLISACMCQEGKGITAYTNNLLSSPSGIPRARNFDLSAAARTIAVFAQFGTENRGKTTFSGIGEILPFLAADFYVRAQNFHLLRAE